MDSLVHNAYRFATSRLQGRLIAPYQREGVMWMLWKELDTERKTVHGGFLCDEMGLGKTVQTISVILGNPKPRTLIIVPKSIVSQWEEEIEHFAPQDLKVIVHDGPDRTKKPEDLLDANVVIAPYSVLLERSKETKGEATVLHRIRWDRVILDEAHEIRNASSKISKSLCILQGKHRWLLTGTPVFNSIKDYISLCKFLGIDKSLIQAMPDKIREQFILRRTKEDVAKFSERLRLPPCDFQNVEIEMYPEEMEMYSTVFNQCRETIKDIAKNSGGNTAMYTMHIFECLLRCRQVMIHPQLYLDGMARKTDEESPDLWEHGSKKIETLVDMVKTHPTEKTLIFSQFISEMEIIHQSILDLGDRQVFRIDGSVSKEGRVEQIKKFRKTSASAGAVFIIQIKAGGQGLNLQEATRVYITAPSWNPATELQAIGRSHRTGQSKKVIVRKLICLGEEELPSIEQSIMSLQGHKALVCAEVLNDPRLARQVPVNTKSKITIQDVKKLFRLNKVEENSKIEGL